MIIGLSGKKRAGKTTLAKYVEKKYEFRRLAFADALKDVAAILFGLTWDQQYGDSKEEKDPINHGYTPRQILQKLGTDVFRKSFPDAFPEFGSPWVHKLKTTIERNPDKNYIIEDCRFPDEVEFIKSLGGMIINIERKTNVLDDHASENQMLDLDYMILNESDEQAMFDQVDTIMMDIEESRQ